METAATATDATSTVPFRPRHRAICMTDGCRSAVIYEPISPHSFALIDRAGMDYEASIGIGPNGRPECPKGHGEMTLADDTMPAADAIQAVADRVEQDRLPFPNPPFHYENALHAVFEKRHSVAALAAIVESKKAKLKAARDEWEEGVAALDRMIAEFERAERDRIAEQERRALAAASPELPIDETNAPADETTAAEGDTTATDGETTAPADDTTEPVAEPTPEPDHHYPQRRGKRKARA